MRGPSWGWITPQSTGRARGPAAAQRSGGHRGCRVTSTPASSRRVLGQFPGWDLGHAWHCPRERGHLAARRAAAHVAAVLSCQEPGPGAGPQGGSGTNSLPRLPWPWTERTERTVAKCPHTHPCAHMCHSHTRHRLPEEACRRAQEFGAPEEHSPEELEDEASEGESQENLCKEEGKRRADGVRRRSDK